MTRKPPDGETWVFACDRCREPRCLFVRVGAELLCADCWRAAGQPAPGRAPASYEHEQTVRRRMAARGGSDRYRVAAGKA